jgi:hypothetical protein
MTFTCLKHGEISWLDARYQAALEGTCQEKTPRAWTKIQENVLAHGKKIGPVDTQYTDAVQTILEPVWTDGIQLWGCTKQSNTDTIQRFQTKVLRNIVDAPWYTRNAIVHRDLRMEMVTNETGKFAKKHEERLHHHVNVEASQLLDNSELVRRLNRKKENLF